MAAFDPDLHRLSLAVYSFLRSCNRWSRLKSGPEDDRGTVADAAGDAAGMICDFHRLSLLIRIIAVVVFKSCGSGSVHTGADLKTFYCSNREDGFCQGSIQFVKYRFSQT